MVFYSKKYVINNLDRELKMMLRNQECRRGETDIHPLFQHQPVNPVTFWYKIKKASGHKTDIALQRYNLVTEEEMVVMKWLDLKNDKHSTMDTYMDT